MIRITRVLLLAAIFGATVLLATACGAGRQAEPTLVPTPVFDPTPAPTLSPSHTTPLASSPKSASPTASAASAGDPKHGKQLAETNGCTACHSTKGSKSVGPTWKGLYGSSVTLNDGSTVTEGDSYLKESIVDPNAQVPKGFFKGIMPRDYGQKLSSSDIQDIIAYIKTLK